MSRTPTKPKRATNNVSDVAKQNSQGQQRAESRSLALTKSEIRTVRDYGQLMLALVTDVIQGNVTPQVLNAAVNAGRQVVKAVELQVKYGGNSTPPKKIESKQSINLLTGQIE